eukprot:m.105077 g.105077  ORF g.105077 m.105077 type:complete len:1072 (-) comp22474_c0_seq1:123-3338(-)
MDFEEMFDVFDNNNDDSSKKKHKKKKKKEKQKEKKKEKPQVLPSPYATKRPREGVESDKDSKRRGIEANGAGTPSSTNPRPAPTIGEGAVIAVQDLMEMNKEKARLKKLKADVRKQEAAGILNAPDESGMVDLAAGFTVKEQSGCIHEVAVPPGGTYKPLSEDAKVTSPAKEYPFTLDPFQSESIKCLERNESVMVSAHTSAGKTVVAEYAIAMCLRNKQRVIYTSPIKALSNQKFRELQEEFTDVGLMTGDITINPSASCLVMTTEILRSMLYRGSEIMREVAVCVYDEIHYMRDKERGVVWEESIILLPDNVRYVFLSATIPNALQFAQWIAQLHSQVCHVVYTDFRPTPLQHYMFPAGGDGLHLVVDERSNFREDNFMKAMSNLGPASAANKRKKPGKGSSDCYRIVKMIMERSYQPVIVFSFSKRECEANALQMSKLDFNTEDEKELVENVFSNAIDSLSDDDKQLPQVEHVLPLLKRGIGIHHSGLLPILKEVIEILFSEGLVKALFATETFAMGLNMPARTCVFTSTRKFDGKDFRWVSSGEYIQMSGRAGRRGLDDRGIVILMVDEKMESAVAKGLLKGQPDVLKSAFHLTYNMVLNLLRVEEINPDVMLEKSFFQFQHTAAVPALEQEYEQRSKELKDTDINENVQEFYMMRQQVASLGADLQSYITDPQYCLSFLNAGRLVKVKTNDADWGWGAVVNFSKKPGPKKAAPGQVTPAIYVVEVLLPCAVGSKKSGKPTPPTKNDKGQVHVVPVLLPYIQRLSSVRIQLPSDLRPSDARESVRKTIKEVNKRFKNDIPLLDPRQDMNIKGQDFEKVSKRLRALEKKVSEHPLNDDPEVEHLLEACQKKAELAETVKRLKKEIKQAQSVLQLDELAQRKRVLRRLDFATKDDVIQLKGRVACEISTGDELVITEMIFNGVFNDLTVNQTVALMSCFVFEEKTQEGSKLSEMLAAPLRQMQDTARRIARVSIECNLPLDEEEYVQSFKSGLMDVVNSWCEGAKFADICKMTDVFEGSIIRVMRRLEELLRQMVQASKAIGNTDLENKFAEGITRIKRDIVFAASLYL